MSDITTDEKKTVFFTPYAIQQTGIICSRCKLIIANQRVFCAPYRLSENRVGIFLSLDVREYNLFREKQSSFCFLSMEFQNRYALHPVSLFLQTTLVEIFPMKNRQNIYQATVNVHNCPDELSSIIKSYVMKYDTLQKKYDKYKECFIYLNSENRMLLPFTNYAVFVKGLLNYRIQIYKFSTQFLSYITPELINLPVPGSLIDTCFAIGKHCLKIRGVVETIGILDADIAGVTIKNRFSPEFSEIVTHYFENFTAQQMEFLYSPF